MESSARREQPLSDQGTHLDEWRSAVPRGKVWNCPELCEEHQSRAPIYVCILTASDFPRGDALPARAGGRGKRRKLRHFQFKVLPSPFWCIKHRKHNMHNMPRMQRIRLSSLRHVTVHVF